MKQVLKWLGWLLVVLLLLLGAAAASLYSASKMPVARDTLPNDYGVGASASLSVSEDSINESLQHQFPPVNRPEGAISDEHQVFLGGMLFYDSVLSSSNAISCASCHHLDRGFSDGRQLGRGTHRNTLSLWNVGFKNSFTWDGRFSSLEEQVLDHISDPAVMGSTDLTALQAEIRRLSDYHQFFQFAFPDETITVELAARALAAFMRTLVSNNSPFDAYVAGQLDALTPSQLRGLNIFRSSEANCVQCHTLPLFASDRYYVTGVPSLANQPHDPGRGMLGDAPDGAFRVPTLRNVVFTAPYMHNGVFSSLEEVLDFYASGGGAETTMVDPLIQPFEMTSQDKEDLIAFMYSLTDETLLPMPVERVASDLPVVPRQSNPIRAVVEEINAIPAGSVAEPGAGRTLEVPEGATIQSVIDVARIGDTVLVPYGVYNESLVVHLDGITIQGIPNDSGDYPVLDGQGRQANAISASGDNFEASYVAVQNYADSGIIANGATNVYLHHLIVKNSGKHGLFALQSSNVMVEYNQVQGASIAGLYASQSDQITIRHNVVNENVIGIQLENTLQSRVYDNHAFSNTSGILLILAPNLASKVSLDTMVFENLVEDNNQANFASAESPVAKLPAGTGIALIATDDARVFDNKIAGNYSAGIGIFSSTILFDADLLDTGDRPEDIEIYNNDLRDNGAQPNSYPNTWAVSGADIVWDLNGAGIQIDQPLAHSFPSQLPLFGWDESLYNMYHHSFQFLLSRGISMDKLPSWP